MKKQFNIGILIVIGAFLLCLLLIQLIKPQGEWGSLYIIIPVMVVMLAFFMFKTFQK